MLLLLLLPLPVLLLPRLQGGLRVEAVGPVLLPLRKEQALLLKGVATAAPYGRGSDTVSAAALPQKEERERIRMVPAPPSCL